MSSRRVSRNKSTKAMSNRRHASSDDESKQIWEFDDNHDPCSIVCTELLNEIVKNPTLNLNALQNMKSDSEDQIMSSEITIVIIAAVLRRLGMKRSSDAFLSKSESGKKLFTDMNLVTDSILQMFCNFVTALAPEVLKTIEQGIIAGLNQTTTARGITHGMTRLALVNDEAAQSGVITENSLKISQFATGLAGRTMNFIKAKKIDSDSEDDLIIPADSVSNLGYPMRFDKRSALIKRNNPKQRKTSATSSNESAFKVNSVRKETSLTERDLMKHVRQRKAGKAMSFDIEYSSEEEPIAIREIESRKKDKTGLGYSSVKERTKELDYAKKLSLEKRKKDEQKKEIKSIALDILQARAETEEESHSDVSSLLSMHN